MMKKKILILLLLCFNYILIAKEPCVNCKAILPKKKITMNNIESTFIPLKLDDNINDIIEITPNKVFQDKEEKINDIEELNMKLENITKEFIAYKVQKQEELEKIEKELELIKNKLYETQNDTPQKELKQIVEYDKEEVFPTKNKLSWVDIIVEDELDIYQLALKYYGDRDKYQQIYQANKNIIGIDLKIKDGMELKIPITEDFIEQPMFLNTD